MQEANCTSLKIFHVHQVKDKLDSLGQPGGAAGRPARTAGSGVGIPASTTGSRTGAGAEAGGSADAGASAATGADSGAGAVTGAVGRPETTGLVGRGAAGSPAITAGLAASGNAVDRLGEEGA